jgi:hypothetical protein
MVLPSRIATAAAAFHAAPIDSINPSFRNAIDPSCADDDEIIRAVTSAAWQIGSQVQSNPALSVPWQALLSAVLEADLTARALFVPSAFVQVKDLTKVDLPGLDGIEELFPPTGEIGLQERIKGAKVVEAEKSRKLKTSREEIEERRREIGRLKEEEDCVARDLKTARREAKIQVRQRTERGYETVAEQQRLHDEVSTIAEWIGQFDRRFLGGPDRDLWRELLEMANGVLRKTVTREQLRAKFEELVRT